MLILKIILGVILFIGCSWLCVLIGCFIDDIFFSKAKVRYSSDIGVDVELIVSYMNSINKIPQIIYEIDFLPASFEHKLTAYKLYANGVIMAYPKRFFDIKVESNNSLNMFNEQCKTAFYKANNDIMFGDTKEFIYAK